MIVMAGINAIYVYLYTYTLCHACWQTFTFSLPVFSNVHVISPEEPHMGKRKIIITNPAGHGRHAYLPVALDSLACMRKWPHLQ